MQHQPSKHTRWFLHTITGITASSVTKIQFEIPTQFKRIKAAYFMASTSGNKFKKYAIGKISLEFNSKKDHLIHEVVYARTIGAYRRKKTPTVLDVELVPGALVTGYYEDGNLINVALYPYNLKIFFDCEVDE